jgi:ADP-ribosyl-[dinitrogen reductase] hydrolase
MSEPKGNPDLNPNMDRMKGCLLGLAAGDAVGTTVEFKARGSFEPVTDMVGGGPFSLQPGEWTDDTSMALCLGFSLLEKRGFDAADQMARYLRWYEEGYMSSNGRCFDIGRTTRHALMNYKKTLQPFSGLTEPVSAGNGSIMRLAPVVLFYFPDRAKVLHFSARSSLTTHALQVCRDACILLGDVLYRALSGESKRDILLSADQSLVSSPLILEIAQGAYMKKTRDQIRGSGYVVNSLEAALWCFWNSDSFRQAILMAVNLGDDADTTAAVCGQVAGAYYGEAGIPLEWLGRLAKGEMIGQLAQDLAGARYLSNEVGL